ncbi:MAG: DUF3227 domain-containing protein [Thaumarchaeota archaeon]|nr:DUF3227 domain-containing protein [Nitrososphaerota archaeon]
MCIDRGVSRFGSDTTKSLYKLLRTKCDLNSDAIYAQPTYFIRALYEVFGETGGRSIERAITKEIKDLYSLELSDCMDLVTAISNASKLVAGSSPILRHLREPEESD